MLGVDFQSADEREGEPSASVAEEELVVNVISAKEAIRSAQSIEEAVRIRCISLQSPQESACD